MVTGKGAEAFHQLPPTASQHGFGATSPPSKRDLASWWRQFKRNTRKEEPKEPQGIFGIPLNVSIKYANVAISLTNDNGESFIYGYVPIVVAKCGVFLKEKATDVEGIFRLSGSAKRIKDLQEIFDSPERYGKGLDWTGYTVHDAANVLRRYLNQLPEPIVPLEFYERFREPLRVYQNQVQNSNGATEPDPFDHAKAVASYQQLIRELPPLNKQLLLYILDLLAVFASKSDQNRMTSANLSAIFQPGLLSHPQHDMAPDEYKLSQDVLIFLIENQDHFLFGMNGTAADEQTVKEVEAGMAHRTATTNSNIRRSVSSASGGGDSFRKYGSLRRNVSVSSKNSRQSNNAQGPTTPTSLGAVGVHRSNTLPSKMSPAMRYGRVTEATGLNSSERTSAQHSRSSSVAPSSREDNPQASVPPQPTPQQAPTAVTPAQGVQSATGLVYVHTSTHGPIPKVIPVQPPVAEAPVQTGPAPVAQAEKPVGPAAPASAPAPAPAPAPATVPATVPTTVPTTVPATVPTTVPATVPVPPSAAPVTNAPVPASAAAPVPIASALQEGLSPPSSPPQTAVTPTRERKISSIFSKSPPSSSEQKEPPRQPNRLKKKRIPGSASESAQSSSQSLQAATSDPTSVSSPPQAGRPVDASPDAAGATPRPPPTSFDDLALRQEKTAVQHENGHQHPGGSGDTTLRPYGSRTPSMNSRSSFTDVSDIDQIDEAAKAERKEHRRSWRFPRSSKRSNEHMGLGLGSPPLTASTPGADRSTSSIGSWHHASRSSPSDLQQFANDPSYQPLSLDAEVSNNGKESGSSEPERRSLFGKFKAKVAQVRDEVKHSSERERTRSPPVQSDPEKSTSSQTLSPVGRDSLPNRPAPIEVVKEPVPPPHTSTPTSPLPPGLPPAIPEEPHTPESPVATLTAPEPKPEGGAEKPQTAGPDTLPTFESHKGDDSETSHFLGN